MLANTSQVKEFRKALESYASSYEVELNTETIVSLLRYYALLNTWNARLHLVAPCAPQEFATRHVLESLLVLAHLPQRAKVADIGSGAGLPIIPCLVARPDINATVIESSKKKAVFLREALTVTETSNRATVVAERFENIATPEIGFVTCRALDRFTKNLQPLIKWSPRPGTLLLFGAEGLRAAIQDAGLAFTETQTPNSQRRFLFVVSRT